MDKNEAFKVAFAECDKAFCAAVSRKIEQGSRGTLIIDYSAKPVSGGLAMGLYEFALACGYEPRFCEKARFNSSARYTFEIQNDGGSVDYISVVRESPVKFKKAERWYKHNGAEKVRRKRRDGR